MLGRHLAGVDCISCLLLVCFLFGRAAEKEMLKCHLAGVGGISCLLLVCALFLVGLQKKKRLNAI
jgi:hypothetical protein